MEKSSNLKLLFLILAGGGPEHHRDEQTQRLTWAKSGDQDTSIIWIKSGVSLRFEESSRTLFVPCSEGDLIGKSVLAIDWACKELDFDVVVRSNVSTFFVIAKLRHNLKRMKFSESSYGGHLHFLPNSSRNKSLVGFISGTGIFMGRRAAEAMRKLDRDYFAGIPDDVAISKYLESHVYLKLHSINRLTLSNHHIFVPSSFIRCKSSWNDKLASQRMLMLYDFFNSESLLQKIRIAFVIMLNEFRTARKGIRASLNYLNRIRVELKELALNQKYRH
jgi:hypothetical protein